MSSRWREDLEMDGIVSIPSVLGSAEVDDLVRYLEPIVREGAGDRTLHLKARIREIATQGPLARLAIEALATDSRASDVRSSPVVARVLYFDKNAAANWTVPYHQDVTVVVREAREIPGYAAWSTKAGMVHVQAPAEVLSKMLAVRLHLDDCGPANGPLRAIPGSHVAGKLSSEDAARYQLERSERTYACPRGGVILMRPLTLHASSPADAPTHRRVLHIEYSGVPLPEGLEWALGWPVPV